MSSSIVPQSINPNDIHGLNKAFIYLQLQREWSRLSHLNSIHQLGHPFGPQFIGEPRPPPRSFSSKLSGSSSSLRSISLRGSNRAALAEPSSAAPSDRDRNADQLPILKFLFQNLALHFPGLNRAPTEVWHNIQFIFDDFNSRNLSTSRERQALTKRLVISVAYTRILTTYISTIASFADVPPKPSRPDSELVKLVDELPDVERVPNPEQPNPAQQRRHWVEAGESIKTAKAGYQAFIGRLIDEEGELDRVFELVAKYDTLADISQVDPIYSHAESWASIWLAYVLHFVYITGPGSEEIRAILIKIEGLIPYELIKQGLKIVNPTLAIKSVVALMLGQPFGGLSLFQRILGSVLNNEINLYKENITDILESQDGDPDVMLLAFETIKEYVYISGQEKRDLWAEFESNDQEIVMGVLSRGGSRLSASQIDLFKAWQVEHNTKPHATAGSILFRNCGDLLRLLVLKRDREQIIEMVLEPNNYIIRTIKLFLELYYPTIYEVAAASDLSRRVADTQAFMKDLIKLFQRPGGPVQVADMIDLLDAHKQSFWRFLHEIVRYKDLCVPMKLWFNRVLGLIKNGSRSATSSSTDSVPKVGVLLKEVCSNELELDAALREARFIASYDISVKALAEVQYRTELIGSKRSEPSYRVPSDFQGEVLKLAKSETQEKTTKNRLLDWAWWICEDKLLGRRIERQVFEETHTVEVSIVPPRLEVIPELLKKYVKLVWT